MEDKDKKVEEKVELASKKDKRILVGSIVGLALLVGGVGTYYTLNSSVDRANKDVTTEIKTQTKESSNTLKKLLGAEESVPTVEQMKNKLGNSFDDKAVEKEYGEGVLNLYLSGLIVPNKDVAELEGSETLRQMKIVYHEGKYINGEPVQTITYTEDTGYKKNVMTNPLLVTEGSYFVDATGFAKVAEGLSAGYFNTSSSGDVTQVTGYLFVEKDMKLTELAKKIETTTLGGKALSIPAEYDVYRETFENLEDSEVSQGMLEAIDSLGYLGDFNTANELMVYGKDVEVLAGTIVPVVGYTKGIEGENIEVKINDETIRLVKQDSDKEIVIGQD